MRSYPSSLPSMQHAPLIRKPGGTPSRVAPVRVLPLIPWAFYTYVFSLLFEMPNRRIPFELPTLIGCLFLLTALLQPRVCFRRLPTAFWLFLVYGCLDTSLMLLSWPGTEYPEIVFKRIFWTF